MSTLTKAHLITCPDFVQERDTTGTNERNHDFNNPQDTVVQYPFFKGLKSFGFGIGYSALLATALLKSSWAWILGNEGLKKADWVPTPGINRSLDSTFLVSRNPFMFVSYKKANLDAILLEKMIWGNNPNPAYLFQGERPNCQIMGALLSNYLTPENLKLLQRSIEITNYSLDENNFYIDSTVHLDGYDTHVPWEDLVKWMSANGITPSHSRDGALAIPILTYALERILTENLEHTFPPSIPSVAPILLTGKNYTVIGISPFIINTLSDHELTAVLSEAPHSPLLVASYGSFDDFKIWVNNKLNGQKDIFQFLPQSADKANEFKRSNIKRVHDLSKDIPIPPKVTSPRKPVSMPSRGSMSSVKTNEKIFPKNHLFVVKEYNSKEATVTLMDTHGVQYPPITKDQFRKLIWCMVVESKHAPTISWETLGTYLAVLLGFYGLKRSSKSIDKKLGY